MFFCNYRDVIYVNVCHNSVKSRYGKPKIQIIIGSIQMAALKDLVRMAKNTALWNTLVIIIGSALQITGLILLWQAMK